MVGPEIALSCWAKSVVTNGAITANIAATGSTVGVVDAAFAMVPGPVRPRGFVGSDGVTLQWVSSASDGGLLTAPRPALCGDWLTGHFHCFEDSHSQFRLPSQIA